jgi:LPS-assembly protein
METTAQYNPRDTRSERLTVAARYQPDLLKTLNMSYRYQRDRITNVDVSAQWALGGSWFGVGRYNYSLKDDRVVEALAGFEYNSDCWIGRVVMQRFAAAAGVASNAVFLQLELNGFSRIGSNPFEVLRRNIPGYTPINQTLTPARTSGI